MIQCLTSGAAAHIRGEAIENGLVEPSWEAWREIKIQRITKIIRVLWVNTIGLAFIPPFI